jgi:hypothetical protein
VDTVVGRVSCSLFWSAPLCALIWSSILLSCLSHFPFLASVSLVIWLLDVNTSLLFNLLELICLNIIVSITRTSAAH